ncbi:MAG TPA: S41 family peptidase [Dongiaceae bacterium]|jgi:carboxyl-terminal processing protease|nr:S41 family peptidase [Dongiaceae bacterium]
MFRTSLLAATALAAGITIGAVAFHASSVRAQAASSSPNTYEQLNLFGEVFERIRDNYVEPTDDEKLIEAAVNGMLTSLDPHSSYLNQKDFGDMQVQTKGEFGGLGIEVTMEDGLIKVVSPMDGTPAAEAGLQPGDLISALDGQPIMGLTLNDAVEKMRGEVGSSIKLTIIRGSQDPFEVTLKRAVIAVKSVRWELEQGNVGYVRISSFSEKTDSGLRDALGKLKEATKGDIEGLVLDLRNNPGGLLDQAIAVCDDFMDKGEIVSTRGRKQEEAQRWNAEAGDLMEGKPIVILINGGSASASEIVSGALQDQRRAIVLGTKSFGKGSVQSIIPIPNHGAIRLTTARYYTPSGRSIQAKGIEPDIEVQQAKVEALGPERGTHESDLRGALSNPDDKKNSPEQLPAETQGVEEQPAAPADSTAAKEAKPEDKEPFVGSEKQQIARPTEDYQLARALDLLRGLSLLQKQAAN